MPVPYSPLSTWNGIVFLNWRERCDTVQSVDAKANVISWRCCTDWMEWADCSVDVREINGALEESLADNNGGERQKSESSPWASERASERDESAARSLPQSSLNHLVHKMPSSHCQTPVFVYNVMTRQCRLLREGAAAMSYQHMKANVHKL